jgi:hypothetical protein
MTVPLSALLITTVPRESAVRRRNSSKGELLVENIITEAIQPVPKQVKTSAKEVKASATKA